MALPKQVEQELKEVEELEKQLMAKPEEAGESEPEQEAPAAEPEKPQEPEPVQQAAPTEPKAVEVPEETWQQKYKTLQGMYDAEVPRLHSQLKEMQSQIEALKKKPEPTKEAEPEPKRKKLVTDADVESFGQDLIDLQKRVAREVAMEFEETLDALKAKNAELEKLLAQTGNQIGSTAFETKLHRMVPDFDSINADPKWVAWLDEYDPIVRGPRRVVAQDAFNRGDAEAIADYVKLFKSTTAPAAAPQKNQELERQVQPTRAANNATPTSQKGKIYSTKEIEKMFEKVTRFNIEQKFDDARKLEAEIDAAYLEGRVTA
jgi:uncharacterized protein YukE